MLSTQTAQEQGKKLGILIAGLQISDVERESLLQLLPQMSEDQLLELTEILEVGYVQSASTQPDVELARDLKQIDDKFAAAVNDLKEKTKQQLDSVV